MKSGFDYYSEDLIKSAEKLLKDLEKFDDLKNLIPRSSSSPGVIPTSGKQELASLVKEAGPSQDARVEIRISEDGMRAFANLYPPKGSGKLPDMDLMRDAVADAGVVFGIDWELVEEAVLRCVTGRKHIADVPIAQGKPPKDEIPLHIEILDTLVNRKPPPEESILQVDYREQSPFLFVKAGDVLAKEIPFEPGEDGMAVLGKAIRHGTKKLPEIVPGENTLREQGEIRAARDGRLVIEGNSFLVHEVLDIPGDVDYSTGNIRFGGDLIVQGSVQVGFILEVGGSILCKNSLDVTRVSAGRDLVVLGGIIGKRKGVVRVAGGIKCRFIEHSLVEAKGPVFAEKAVLHSLISTKDAVSLGKKGVVIGGRLYAQNGISTNQLGSDMGTKTEIHIGVDPEVERKILWLQDKGVDITVKLKEITRRLASRPENKELLSLKERLAKQLALIEDATQDLVSKLDRNEAAEVSATGYVFPGVSIEICHTLFVVTEVMKNQRFYLDKDSGTVKNQSLGSA